MCHLVLRSGFLDTKYEYLALMGKVIVMISLFLEKVIF